MYTSVSDTIYTKLTTLINDIGENQDTSSEMTILKGLLPTLILTRGLITPKLYQTSIVDAEVLILVADSSPGSSASPPVGGGGGSWGGTSNSSLGSSEAVG